MKGASTTTALMPEQEKAVVSQDSSLQSLIQWAGTSVRRLSFRLLANGSSAATESAASPAVVRVPFPYSPPIGQGNYQSCIHGITTLLSTGEHKASCAGNGRDVSGRKCRCSSCRALQRGKGLMRGLPGHSAVASLPLHMFAF